MASQRSHQNGAKKFKSEKETIREAINQLVINTDTEIKDTSLNGFEFYIVFARNYENEPHWGDSYIASENFWYFIGEKGITRICKYKSLAIYFSNQLISNVIEIPSETIPYEKNKIISEMNFSQKDVNSKIPHVWHNTFIDDTDIERLKAVTKCDNIIAKKIKYYTSIMSFRGLIIRINFYPEGSKKGESILIKKEAAEKMDDDFEEQYNKAFKKHIIDSLKKADFNKGLEKLLCETMKKSYAQKCHSLPLNFDFCFYNKKYTLHHIKPNIKIGFEPIEISCNTGYAIEHKISELNSDNSFSIEMSDLFWKHYAENSLSIDYYSSVLSNLTDNRMINAYNEDFCEIVREQLVEKVKETGLEVINSRCTFYEDDDDCSFEIIINNPLFKKEE